MSGRRYTWDSECSVAIIGAGPVGLLLALDLRRAGVDVGVFDLRTRPRTESRATTLNSRSIQLLRTRGVVDRLGQMPHITSGHFAGIPITLDSAMPGGGQWKCSQGALEAALIEELREVDLEVRWGHSLNEMTSNEQENRVRFINSGNQIDVKASYVVGCDGEKSTVRRFAGIRMDGRKGTRHLIRADVTGADIKPRKFQILEKGMATASPLPSEAVRIMAYHSDMNVQDVRHVDYSEVCDIWESLTGDDIRSGSASWIDSFTDDARWATTFRRGRVLLAGDAAHVMMPAGGLPLNLGLDDAARLSWRLAAVDRKVAHDTVLTDYSDEGVERARVAARHTSAQAHLLLSSDDIGPQRRLMAELLRLDSVHQEVVNVLSGTPTPIIEGSDLVGVVVPSIAILEKAKIRNNIAPHLANSHAVLWSREAACCEVLSAAANYQCVVQVGDLAGNSASLFEGFNSALIQPDGIVSWTDRSQTTLSDALAKIFRSTTESTGDIPQTCGITSEGAT